MTRKRTDDNQTAIVQALRDAGASVQSLASIGKGCPDLLVARNGRLYLMEIKTDRGRPTKDQGAWMDEWHGTVYIVRSVEQALAVIGITAGANTKG